MSHQLSPLELKSLIWRAADAIHGTRMTTAEMTECVLTLVALKRLSDVFDWHREMVLYEARSKGKSIDDRKNHYFYGAAVFVPESARWDWMVANLAHGIGKGLVAAFQQIFEHNPHLGSMCSPADAERAGSLLAKLSDNVLRSQMRELSAYRLSDFDLERPDALQEVAETASKDVGLTARQQTGIYRLLGNCQLI